MNCYTFPAFFTSRNSSIDVCQIEFDNEKSGQNIVFTVSVKKYCISSQNDSNILHIQHFMFVIGHTKTFLFSLLVFLNLLKCYILSKCGPFKYTICVYDLCT